MEEPERHFCPICNNLMTFNKVLNYYNYGCGIHDTNHHLFYRVQNNKISKLRIRLQDGNQMLRLKVHYDENYSEVWVQKNVEKIIVNSIIPIDFSNLEKLKDTLRVILLFG